MKNGILLILLFASSFYFTACEKDKYKIKEIEKVHFVESIQPSAENGKDAFIYNHEKDRNLGTHPDFMASTWTAGGSHVTVRSLIQFDFSVIPSDAIIDSVKLSLFSYSSPSNGSHASSNSYIVCLLERIVSSWSENSVTWNNQPSTSSENYLNVLWSDNSKNEHIDMDVTDLMKEMIKNPSKNYGLMLKLKKEEIYNRMVFASSDNSNSNLHPKIDVYYTISDN